MLEVTAFAAAAMVFTLSLVATVSVLAPKCPFKVMFPVKPLVAAEVADAAVFATEVDSNEPIDVVAAVSTDTETV